MLCLLGLVLLLLLLTSLLLWVVLPDVYSLCCLLSREQVFANPEHVAGGFLFQVSKHFFFQRFVFGFLVVVVGLIGNPKL